MIDRSCITGRPELPPQLRTFPCSNSSASSDIKIRDFVANGLVRRDIVTGACIAARVADRRVGSVVQRRVAMRDASRDARCDEPSRQFRVCAAKASTRRHIAFVHENRRLELGRGLSVASDEKVHARRARQERGSRTTTRAEAHVGERSTP